MSISRREALQNLAGSLGAAFSVPAHARSEHHPVRDHVAQRSTKSPETLRAETSPFLDTHQLATLALVADLVVPGAVASESPAVHR